MKPTTSNRIRLMVVTAMLTALAFLATFLLHFKVMFLTFDLKDAILAVIALLYGPGYGMVSVTLVALLEFVTVSDTGWYGLLMNALSSGAFVLAAGVVYKNKRDFYGALMAMGAAVVAMTGIMLLANCLITPFYLGATREEVTALIPTLLLPFNVCKAVMNAAALLLLYKPLIGALRRTGLVEIRAAKHNGKMSLIVALIAVALIAVVSVVLVFGFDATVDVTLLH